MPVVYCSVMAVLMDALVLKANFGRILGSVRSDETHTALLSTSKSDVTSQS